ncbi:hypothetical protein PPERSA_02916 [Pseudocohnilembus persalinus]|uniref:Uncharacterized protein n=1 Tax=Pseudocohnilembus persalinus TaxID=266149 RepID=A0A0V0QN80_PSEPJ|nr:hypothetical protein PPERSA_02916 [Pseudocohnilembus persalinus]|eukprot:KRX03537.1 hypothetical protein PPERSA_02916 [Pseudocohnilembus persalinus]
MGNKCINFQKKNILLCGFEYLNEFSNKYENEGALFNGMDQQNITELYQNTEGDQQNKNYLKKLEQIQLSNKKKPKNKIIPNEIIKNLSQACLGIVVFHKGNYRFQNEEDKENYIKSKIKWNQINSNIQKILLSIDLADQYKGHHFKNEQNLIKVIFDQMIQIKIDQTSFL